MFLRTVDANPLESFINTFFSGNKAALMELHTKQFNEEDIKEYSKYQYDIIKYYAALHLVILIWLEVQNGVQTDWNYYSNKYDLPCKKKSLACYGISLDNILKSFGLPIIANTGGIGGMKIEYDFIVEPTDITIPTVINEDINTLLETEDACYDYLNTVCNPLNITTPTNIPSVMPPATITGRIYYGTSLLTSLVEADVIALANNALKTTLVGNYSFNVGGYKYIAIPVSLGTPSSILDNATQLNMVMESPLGITINLAPYNLYRSTNILGGNITMKLV
jgi:hypothetical protein